MFIALPLENFNHFKFLLKILKNESFGQYSQKTGPCGSSVNSQEALVNKRKLEKP